MDLRKIDVLVAQAMGLEVIGEAWASRDPEDPHYWHVHAIEWTGRTLQPVYVCRCSCDLYPSDTPELDPTEKVQGHYVYCLEVVPHYTADIATACLVWDTLPWPKYYTRLVQTDTGNWRFDIEANGGDGPVYSASAETRELAICLAFLRARGVEVEDEQKA